MENYDQSKEGLRKFKKKGAEAAAPEQRQGSNNLGRQQKLCCGKFRFYFMIFHGPLILKISIAPNGNFFEIFGLSEMIQTLKSPI